MMSDTYVERISDDWLWREKELRDTDSLGLKHKNEATQKSRILISYSHWEGMFKFCATELLDYINDGVRRKIFKWTDIRPEIRLRLLFCSYRKSSISGQTQETFISYLNAIQDERFSRFINAKDEIILVDDNLNSLRADAICRNLGVDSSWCMLKKIVIDDRILSYRNAIAHGARRLSSGDELDVQSDDIDDALGEIRNLIRETKDRFQNAIVQHEFIK